MLLVSASYQRTARNQHRAVDCGQREEQEDGEQPAITTVKGEMHGLIFAGGTGRNRSHRRSLCTHERKERLTGYESAVKCI